jgi:hypothetical protein
VKAWVAMKDRRPAIGSIGFVYATQAEADSAAADNGPMWRVVEVEIPDPPRWADS